MAEPNVGCFFFFSSRHCYFYYLSGDEGFIHMMLLPSSPSFQKAPAGVGIHLESTGGCHLDASRRKQRPLVVRDGL